jgi:WD40 repeat protein
VALASADGKARIFDRQGKLLREVEHPASVIALSYSDDGRALLTGSLDGTLKLTGAVERTFGLGQEIHDAKISPDGHRVGAAGSAGLGKVWDVRGGAVVETLSHDTPLRRVVFDRQGKRVLFCGQDGAAVLRDLGSDQERTFWHDLYATNGSFDKAGKRIITTSVDGAVKVWDTETGEQLSSPEGHDGPVLIGVLSPDESLILSVSKDGTAQLWQTETGLPFGLPIRHQRIAYDGAFSQDGKLVVTGGHDGVVQFTDLPLQPGAVIPDMEQLEHSLGSRLTESDGGNTVCEAVPRT